MYLSICFHRLHLPKNQEKLGLAQKAIAQNILKYLIINLLQYEFILL